MHALGAELPLSGTAHARDAASSRALAERSPDRSPHREDEPYRRALTGIYARLAATAEALGLQARSSARAVGSAEPYRGRRASSSPTLDVIDASLRAGGSALLADGRLRMLRKAVRRLRLPPRHASTCARTPTSTRR